MSYRVSGSGAGPSGLPLPSIPAPAPQPSSSWFGRLVSYFTGSNHAPAAQPAAPVQAKASEAAQKALAGQKAARGVDGSNATFNSFVAMAYNPLQNGSQVLPATLAFKALEQQFGRHLVSVVCNRYGFARNALTLNQFRALLVGVCTNATQEHIERSTETFFSDLSQAQICALVDQFRAFSRSELMTLTELSLTSAEANRALKDDLLVFKKLHGTKNFTGIDAKANQSLATGECLADLAYAPLREGMLVTILDANGNPIVLQVEAAIDEKGIGWFLLVPVKKEANSEIFVICRGTVNTSAPSMRRDFEPGAAGIYSASVYKGAFMRAIKSFLLKHPDLKFQFHFAGHSLGTSDAFTLLLDLVDAVSYKDRALSNVASVKATLCNAPGTTPDRNARLVAAEARINSLTSVDDEDGFEHVERVNSDFRIAIRHVKKKGDIVQRCGYEAIGRGLRSDRAVTEIFQFDGGDKGRVLSNGLRAHTSRVFNNPFHKAKPCEYANSDGDNSVSYDRWTSNNFGLRGRAQPVVMPRYEGWKNWIGDRLFGNPFAPRA